jgi:hypothetical protein
MPFSTAQPILIALLISVFLGANQKAYAESSVAQMGNPSADGSAETRNKSISVTFPLN